MSLEDELRDYTQAALSRYDRTPEPDEFDSDELEEDQQAGDEVDEEALPAGWNEWVDSLTPAEIEHAKGDADWAEAQFARWQVRQDDQGSDDAGQEVDEAPPTTSSAVVDWVMDHEAEIQAAHHMSAHSYLALLAGSSRAEWTRWANEAGVPVSARPGYGQLTRRAQTELVRADLVAMTQDAWDRLGK
jgi:hypothetical protein